MRRSLRPRMNPNCIPAISPASSGGAGGGTKVGFAIPGGPPMLEVGTGVGRPGSGCDGWTGTGTDGGVSRDAAPGPQAVTEIRSAARKRVLTTQAYRRSGHVVRILRSCRRRDTKFVEVRACHHAV